MSLAVTFYSWFQEKCSIQTNVHTGHVLANIRAIEIFGDREATRDTHFSSSSASPIGTMKVMNESVQMPLTPNIP